jgi:hypothetical protein
MVRSILVAALLSIASVSFAGQTIMSTPMVLVPIGTSRLNCTFTNVSNKPITLTTFVIDEADNILSRGDYTVPASQAVVFEFEFSTTGGYARCAFDFTPGSAKSVRASALVWDLVSGNPLITVPAS